MMQDIDAPRVLVADDEANIRSSLVRALELSGYRAIGVASGKDALAVLDQAVYDVMLLDIKMPGMDGVEVMRRARQAQPDLMILVLTGHATLESAIVAVKTGAVDYLLKPVSVRDITEAIAHALKKQSDQARPKRLLRTILDTLQQAENSSVSVEKFESDTAASPPRADAKPSLLRVGALALDPEKRLVVIDERPIELTEGEITILTLLMKQPDQVLSCRDLTQAAWHYDLEEWEAQALVRPYIFRLRQKIEATPGDPKFIRTVRGRGYLLASA